MAHIEFGRNRIIGRRNTERQSPETYHSRACARHVGALAIETRSKTCVVVVAACFCPKIDRRPRIRTLVGDCAFLFARVRIADYLATTPHLLSRIEDCLLVPIITTTVHRRHREKYCGSDIIDAIRRSLQAVTSRCCANISMDIRSALASTTVRGSWGL